MRPRTMVREIARKLKVEDGDIIVMKIPKGNNNMDGRTFDAMRNAMYATNRRNCVVVAVKDLEEIEVLDERAMNQLGWFRGPATTDEEE